MQISRRFRIAVVLGFLAAAIVAATLVGEATAKPREPVLPPEDCGTCDPAYIGPNGGVCQPLGCVRPGGACVYGGDCY